MDLNKNHIVDKDEQQYANLDDLLAFISASNDPAFVKSPVNLIFETKLRQDNPAAIAFLDWVYAKGQSLNDDLGFLPLKFEELGEQVRKLRPNSAAACVGADAVSKKRKEKYQYYERGKNV